MFAPRGTFIRAPLLALAASSIRDDECPCIEMPIRRPELLVELAEEPVLDPVA